MRPNLSRSSSFFAFSIRPVTLPPVNRGIPELSISPPLAPTAAPVLELKDVRVRFGNLLAVRDVSFALTGGTLLGLIGPNGAGKTTLLRAVAGLQPTTRGTIEILGEPLSPDALHQIGFTPDVPPVYDELTVRQFLTFVGKGYDLAASEIRERTDFWLEKVWLTDKADQKVKGLSRGMKQRLGIARTLLPNPALILLDEPAAGLDPAGRVQFRQLLADLRDQGKTIVISSHILADMDEYCTHIAIMSMGGLRQFGTVQEITAGHDAGRRRYQLTLAHPVADLKDRLANLPNVSNIAIERDRATLELGATPDDAATALATLVALRLPNATFAPTAANLEEAYLRANIGQVD
jgi:ABC-2 type transport system ATP-binding protein